MPKPLVDFGDLPRQARSQFVAALDRGLKKGTVNVRDNPTFIRILKTAVQTCGLDQNGLAELFETSHTSISRWINGKTLPHPQYREPIVKKLRDMVDSMSHGDLR